MFTAEPAATELMTHAKCEGIDLNLVLDNPATLNASKQADFNTSVMVASVCFFGNAYWVGLQVATSTNAHDSGAVCQKKKEGREVGSNPRGCVTSLTDTSRELWMSGIPEHCACIYKLEALINEGLERVQATAEEAQATAETNREETIPAPVAASVKDNAARTQEALLRGDQATVQGDGKLAKYSPRHVAICSCCPLPLRIRREYE
jgi:hypothetical protein